MSDDRWMVEPCSDGNCILRGPSDRGGMHTNGGCQHLKLTPARERLSLVRALAAEVACLRAALQETELLALMGREAVKAEFGPAAASPPGPALRIRRVRPDALIPAYATADASGLDLHACIPESWLLRAGDRLTIPTGVAIELPDGYEGQVRPRSGLAAKYGITVLNTPGTIDADYRGEVCVVLVNTDPHDAYSVRPGDRIAQLVVAPVARVEVVQVEELGETERGEGGFGSTGT